MPGRNGAEACGQKEQEACNLPAQIAAGAAPFAETGVAPRLPQASQQRCSRDSNMAGTAWAAAETPPELRHRQSLGRHRVHPCEVTCMNCALRPSTLEVMTGPSTKFGRMVIRSRLCSFAYFQAALSAEVCRHSSTSCFQNASARPLHALQCADERTSWRPSPQADLRGGISELQALPTGQSLNAALERTACGLCWAGLRQCHHTRRVHGCLHYWRCAHLACSDE